MHNSDHSDIEIFEFPIFRLENLILSIPASGLLLWGFVKFIPIMDEWVLGSNPIFKLLMMILSLGIFCFILIKTFFSINARKTVIYLNNKGFWQNSLDGKVILWKDVQYITFSKDKYERQSNSTSSSIFFSLGQMKMLHLHCTTWTIINRTKRTKYNQNFEAFKMASSKYCQVHSGFRN